MAAADTINGSVQSAAGVPHETRHPHQHEEYTDDGQTFTISLVNSERLAGKDQISTSIPGAGLISELEIAEVDERPPKLQVNGGAAPASPEPESPTASPTRRHSHTLPAEYDGGEESDIPPGADEGADGRGPGGHEADLRHVPVDGGAGGVSHARRRGPTTPTRTHASLSDHAHDGSPRRNRALEDVTTSPRNHHAMHPSERGHENPNGVIVLDSPIIEDDIAHVPQPSHPPPAMSSSSRVKAITPPPPVIATLHSNGKQREVLEDEALPPMIEDPSPDWRERLKNMNRGTLPPGGGDWADMSPSDGRWRSALDSGASTPGMLPPKDGNWSAGQRHSWSEAQGGAGNELSADSVPAQHGTWSGGPPPGLKGKPGRSSTMQSHSRTPGHTSGDDGPTVPSTPKVAGKRALRFPRMLSTRRASMSAAAQPPAIPEVTPPSMTSEMMAGTLPVMILKTWLDRDEDGHRAVPVLLGNLRFRVGDSVGSRAGKPGQGREMFKIECEYGDGAVKWIVYRELRDFLSLHAHYKAANIGTRVTGLRSSRHVEIPEFPRSAIPYWARESYYMDWLEGKGDYKGKKAKAAAEAAAASDKQKAVERGERGHGRQEFSPASRDALQQYLIDLIRAVMFRPESNRLCTFFELSALTVALAPRGGFQGKAGFLKIPTANASRRSNQPGILPSSWVMHRRPKWFIVRESYFVAAEGPEETEFYDVFLIDSDFSIERPKRAYRQGLHLLSGSSSSRHHEPASLTAEGEVETAEEKNEQAQEVDDEKKASQHTFYISNAQRRLKLVAKNARQMHQFIISMERIAMECIWAGRNRFDSFAPVRLNVAAQWLVDGRDYFWNLSRAMNMAKSRIYIHDWWISPQIYLRRPGDERYRLDNLLKRKAEEGVRIFIIIYNEVSAKTTPVESLYVKKTLTGLHPNIMVQRSPSHLPNGALYWSHHEKLCVIDETIAFMGGLDLCFGRWDTSQHIMTDEDYTMPDGPDGPVWRGKDYWNERVAEFHDLEKPMEDTFDRNRIPRMPWHDVGLQIVGQPSRDLCRHFVQRWNYLLRVKNHRRQMPFLVPPADFTETELVDLKLQGTCEVQICRSVGPWSMGTTTKIEHSIQNAYVKSIQLSEHFVYIENQFFITSTVVNGIQIENNIGNALVNRIIKAHRDGTPWRACVVIPLLPGYTHPIDSAEASSVRLILECQNRTISRGPQSIFARLRKEGINPDDYISFFSLRGWCKFNSGALATEMVYIHGKTMIVDDRLVLCGSANINERSQRGDRDSELVAVIRDTDMIDGTMAGKPFKVGRFAHTLRVRLMREHAGVDVDEIDEDELMLRKPVAEPAEIAVWDPDHEQTGSNSRRGITRVKKSTPRERLGKSVSAAVGSIAKGVGENMKGYVDKTVETVTAVEHEAGGHRESFQSDNGPTMEERAVLKTHAEHGGAAGHPEEEADALGALDDGDARGLAQHLLNNNLKSESRWSMPIDPPKMDPNLFHDPLDKRFWDDIWVAAAVFNTEVFRKVFRTMPDDLVSTWAQYKEYATYFEKFFRAPGSRPSPTPEPGEQDKDKTNGDTASPAGQPAHETTVIVGPGAPGDEGNKPSGEHEPWAEWELKEMEKLLNELRGTLVVYSTHFLEAEDQANNFLFNQERILPLLIYD